MVIEFEWDSRNLPFGRGNKQVEKALQRALRMAGNAAIKEAKVASADHVTNKRLIARTRVEDGLPLDMPKGSDAIADLEWKERISGKGMALAKFPSIQTALGAYVRISPTSGFKRIKGAFIARMDNGHLGIWRRTGPGRTPIKELWTTRISDAMSDPGAIDVAQDRGLAKLQTAFAKGLEREFQKLRKKGGA